MIIDRLIRAQIDKSLGAYGLGGYANKLPPEMMLAMIHAVKELVNKELAKEQEK
jgi:hypothetical protein